MRRILSAMSLMSLIVVCGCQSWSQVGQGFPNGTRVAPPGTGTFNVPSSYYNKGASAVPSTSANANSASSTMGRTAGFNQAPTPNEVVPASYQLPTVDQVRTGINNTAGAVLNDVSTRANQAVQTGTSRVANAVQQYTMPVVENAPPALAAPAGASQSLSDTRPSSGADAGPPTLDWQAPN